MFILYKIFLSSISFESNSVQKSPFQFVHPFILLIITLIRMTWLTRLETTEGSSTNENQVITLQTSDASLHIKKLRIKPFEPWFSSIFWPTDSYSSFPESSTTFDSPCFSLLKLVIFHLYNFLQPVLDFWCKGSKNFTSNIILLYHTQALPLALFIYFWLDS